MAACWWSASRGSPAASSGSAPTRSIVAFEGAYAATGTAIVKLWLQITPEEQLRRFEARAADPFKEYKLTDDDWRNRERADDYAAAAGEMLRRTHSAEAPWTLVSAEDKYHARAQVLETVVARLRSQLGS